MNLRFLGLLMLTMPVWGQAIQFKNDREGKSVYSGLSYDRVIEDVQREVDGKQIVSAFGKILAGSTEQTICSFDVNKKLVARLQEFRPKFNELKGAIYYLRSQNEMDDVYADILLKAVATSETKLEPVEASLMSLPSNRLPKLKAGEKPDPKAKSPLAQMLDVVVSFEKNLGTACLDDGYRGFLSSLRKVEKDIKDAHIIGVVHLAFEKKLIKKETFEILEKSRISELGSYQLTIRSYRSKLKTLRTQFPLRSITEQSDFVSDKDGKTSRRQRLLQNYDYTQIALMAEVIKKLRRRLESPRGEIVIFDKSNGSETILLDPMDRFRLAIKLMQSEMIKLSTNDFFGGRNPSYIDLITASYEIGMIPASELKEVAGLEDVWNPKKTFWEKASMWVRTFSNVATVALPQPYGFIPALVLVIIEATVGKPDQDTNDPTRLF